MKKKTVRKRVKRSTKRAVHHHAVSHHGSWGKDRSMIIMLAAGTIVLVVIGMYMAGWL